MTKKYLLLLICGALTFGSVKKAQAQKYLGETVISAGAGWSLISTLFEVEFNGFGNDFETFHTPVFLFAVDHAIANNFSVGVAASHQRLGIDILDYEYENSVGDYVNEEVRFKMDRINLGVRPLVHFDFGSDLDFYMGARIGYQFWTITNNSSDPAINDPTSFEERTTFQPLMGLRADLNRVVGLHGELAIGSPYLAMVGINFRI